MKKSLLTLLCFVVYLSTNAQTKVNYHYQKFFPSLKVNQLSEDGIAYLLEPRPGNGSGQLVKLNLVDTTTCYSRDSLPNNVSYVYIDSNTVYMPENGNGLNSYLTKDGFKTIQKYNFKMSNVKKVSAGYLANSNSFYKDLMFSTDLINWTKIVDFNGTVVEINDVVYYMKNLSNIDKSIDGGATFTNIRPTGSTQLLDLTLNFLYANDNQEFLVTDRNTFYFYSDDGCQSWKKKIPRDMTKTFLYANGMDSIYFTSNDRGLYISLDTCKTIVKIPDVTIPASMQGKTLTSYKGRLYYDGNADWLMSANKPEDNWRPHYNAQFTFGTILVKNNNTYLALNTNGAFALSKNGGLVFDTVSIGVGQTIYDVADAFILNDSTFFILERNGKIFTSKDTGKTWTSQSESDSQLNGLGKFRYKKETNTLSITYNNKTKYSTDNGQTWRKYGHQPRNSVETLSPNLYIQAYPTVYHADYIPGTPVPTTTRIVFEKRAPQGNFGTEIKFNQIPNSDTLELITMRMYNQNLGFMLVKDQSYNLLVYKTENAWVNFNNVATIPDVESPTNLTIVNTDTIHFIDEHTFYYSYDGGLNWAKTTFTMKNYNDYISPTGLIFNNHGGFMISSSLGILGEGALVPTNTTDPYTAISNDYYSTSVISNLFYPNPANDKIQMVNSELFDKVRIYNMGGEIVLESKSINLIDISILNSGIYLLKAEGSNNTLTQKLIKK